MTMAKNITQVIEMHASDPDMIGGYVTILPDGSQIMRALLIPLEEVTRELYDGYQRCADNPVQYRRFRAAYKESQLWAKGVVL